MAAVILPSTQGDAIIRHLEQQQQHLDTLDEIIKIWETLIIASQLARASTSYRQGNHSFGMKGRGKNLYTERRGDPGGRGLPSQSRLRGQPIPQ